MRLYERRADARRVALAAGRSINLALAARGIAALERAGLMRGRAPAAGTDARPHGPRPRRRCALPALRPAAARAPVRGVARRPQPRAGRRRGSRRRRVPLRARLPRRGLRARPGRIEDLAAGRRLELPLGPLLAADGSGSALRHAMVAAGLASAREETLAHRYKELTIPASRDGRHQLALGALHIWPRGGYMLIALPNVDGSVHGDAVPACRGRSGQLRVARDAGERPPPVRARFRRRARARARFRGAVRREPGRPDVDRLRSALARGRPARC